MPTAAEFENGEHAHPMEIHYQNTRQDFLVCYREVYEASKPQSRREAGDAWLWFAFVLILGAYVAFIHEEMFILCVFAAIGFWHVRGMGFERRWNQRLESAVAAMPETRATLLVEDKGLRECNNRFEFFIPWSEVQDYMIIDERLLIRGAGRERFIVPLRYLSSDEQAELTRMLEERDVLKKAS